MHLLVSPSYCGVPLIVCLSERFQEWDVEVPWNKMLHLQCDEWVKRTFHWECIKNTLTVQVFKHRDQEWARPKEDSEAKIVRATLRSSPLWTQLHVAQLQENVRVRQGQWRGGTVCCMALATWKWSSHSATCAWTRRSFRHCVIEFRRQNSRIKIRLQLAESRQDPYPSTLSKSQALKRNGSWERVTNGRLVTSHCHDTEWWVTTRNTKYTNQY